jgi:hypothetical protein
MKDQNVLRDERTEVVENASYRLAYTLISFGVLLSVVYRGFVLNQSSWDLLALVILSSGVATFYQGKHKILDRRMLLPAIILMVSSALIAMFLVWLLTRQGNF